MHNMLNPLKCFEKEKFGQGLDLTVVIAPLFHYIRCFIEMGCVMFWSSIIELTKDLIVFLIIWC